jgi:hypothetical protein
MVDHIVPRAWKLLFWRAMRDGHDQLPLKKPTFAVLTAIRAGMADKIRLHTCRFLEQLCRIGALFFLTGSLTCWSATYYAAKNGSDSNSGTSGAPWLTVAKATASVAAGDTVKFGAGEWRENLNTVVAGTAEARIIWDGQGLAKINTVYIDQPYNTLQNFEVTLTNHLDWYLVNINTGGDHAVVTNCYLHSPVGPNGSPLVKQLGGVLIQQGTGKPFDDKEPSNCEIVNNFFNLLSGEYPAFNVSGTNNLIRGNVCTNFYQGNGIYLYGRYNKIIRNTFDGTAKEDGTAYGSHPDWVQYFGFLGWGSIGHILDGNVVNDTWATGQATRGNGAVDPLAADATNGVYHGNWIFRNNIIMNQRQTASLAIPKIQWLNNLFYRCNYDAGHAISAVTGPNGCGEGVVILNNAFIDCGLAGSSNQCWYAIADANGPTLAKWTADYNYVAKNNWGPVMTAASPTGYRFKEPHMINGGDPKFAYFSGNNTLTKDFRLLYNSPLIDTGMNLSSVTEAIDGMVRPLGAKTDIGPYEFDPNLLVHFDFTGPLTGKVPDVTGHGHDAWQMDATNWITAQGGYGVWTKIGTINNNGSTYDLSQYGAITNISGGLEYITNGTIMVRALWGPDTARWDTILDSGDLVAFTPDPKKSTNSWSLSWGWPNLSVSSELPSSGAVFRKWPIQDYTDTNTVVAYWANHPHDGSWQYLAVSWDAAANQVIAYFAGVPISTNALNAPYLRVASPRSWITLGAMQHSGTPQWDTPTDKFPNSGFFKGKMDDVRIYNRVLAASEIASLYRGTGCDGGPDNSAPNNFSDRPPSPGNLHTVKN